MTKRLGKGLEELFEGASAQRPQHLVWLQIDQIRPCRFQPRNGVREEALQDLVQSVKRQGLIQPVIVRPLAHGTYELVAGERRWRAAQLAGLKEIPAVIKPLNDQQTLECSLIENGQREDLNPLEEAAAYERMSAEFSYTQEAIAEAVGKDRATIANALRLLRLPQEIQQAIREERISRGHAKALLAVEAPAKLLELFNAAVREQWSVRRLEAMAGTWQPARRKRAATLDPQLNALQDELRRALGTKVRLASRKKGGRIIIEYFSSEELTRLLHILNVNVP
jgi:ParB family chromosome partitioning protein